MMNKIFSYICISAMFILMPITGSAQNDAQKKTDPNMTALGGYGYLFENSSTASVWWAEATYKVMRNAPIPTKQKNSIEISSARNEYESFIVVINPKRRLNDVRVDIANFEDANGNAVQQPITTVRKVEYVNVSIPTDDYGAVGSWPDPLPLYKSPETIYASENQPFWITIKTPKDMPSGNYNSSVTLSEADGWHCEIPIKLQVRKFTLPQTPSMRSGFGMSINRVAQYDNLQNYEQKKQAFEYYMQAFRDYKISPYNPFEFSPIIEKVDGIAWKGGLFDNKQKHSCKYSYLVIDNSTNSDAEAVTQDLIPINNNQTYKLQWYACSKEKHSFVVGVECYDRDRKLIAFHNTFDQFEATPEWKEYSLNLGTTPNDASFVRIRLFGASHTSNGENTGTMWYDDVQLMNQTTNKNEFLAGNFEVDIDKINIHLDFSDFKKAAHRYFNEYGFTGFNLRLKGLGGGTYYSRQGGIFEGFQQGTDEYMKLMKQYLEQIQNNLQSCGLLGKEYIYWFDEPGKDDYPFIHETHAMIKKLAPKLTTFLTEHMPEQDISDVTDISCTIWHKLNQDKINKINSQPGKEYWTYLCTGPKSPWITEFIDHDAINMRLWLWASYIHKVKGILIWETTYWNSSEASPVGYLQNPWDNAQSYVTGYGWPQGKQTTWGNGDGRFFYPSNRNPNGDKRTYLEPPVPSVRLEIMRDGIEDYEYLVMLENLINKAPKSKKKLAVEAKKLLTIPQDIYNNDTNFTKDALKLIEYRLRIADYIELLQNKNK